MFQEIIHFELFRTFNPLNVIHSLFVVVVVVVVGKIKIIQD